MANLVRRPLGSLCLPLPSVGFKGMRQHSQLFWWILEGLLCIDSYKQGCYEEGRVLPFLPASLISVSYLTSLDRTSSKILKRNGESGHPCLASDFSENASSFSLFSMMLALGLYVVFILRYVPACIDSPGLIT